MPHKLQGPFSTNSGVPDVVPALLRFRCTLVRSRKWPEALHEARQRQLCERDAAVSAEISGAVVLQLGRVLHLAASLHFTLAQFGRSPQ